MIVTDVRRDSCSLDGSAHSYAHYWEINLNILKCTYHASLRHTRRHTNKTCDAVMLNCIHAHMFVFCRHLITRGSSRCNRETVVSMCDCGAATDVRDRDRRTWACARGKRFLTIMWHLLWPQWASQWEIQSPNDGRQWKKKQQKTRSQNVSILLDYDGDGRFHIELSFKFKWLN